MQTKKLPNPDPSLPLRGWYVAPQIQKDLMHTKYVKLWTSAFVGWYATPRIQKDLMQTKKVSKSAAPDGPAALPGAPVPSAVTLYF